MNKLPLIQELNEAEKLLILQEFREREPMVDGDAEEVLAPHKVKDMQVLIRKGAKDLDQDWKSAVHLVNKAYKVGGHTIPTPDMKDGHEQYEYLIGFTVGVLSSVRGPYAKWRVTTPKKYDTQDEAIEQMLKKMPGYTDVSELEGGVE